MTKPLVAISLGWGVQSFALAAMSALGELPPVDVAIHADTTHERSETYEFAERWTPWLEERRVKVVTVKAKPARLAAVRDGAVTSVMIPVFTTYANGSPSGMMRRQCTHDWKIAPIRRWLQANRKGRAVEQWLGITLDEIERARHGDVKYITHRFPFLESPMRRWEVIQWLHDNGIEVPVKSGCVFCPYHDRATWREIQMSGNGDWQKALEVDEAIRNKRPNYVCYVHRDRKPLAEIDLRDEQDHGQLSLWSEECEGYCFL